MQRLSHQTRCFDGFTLDLTRGCLLRGAEEIKLRPKPFEALKYLVENAGRLVSKKELIQVIWPDTAVTDDSLVQCLIEVRRALGDDDQQIIKTVPRRGYIFDKSVARSPTALTTYTEESGVHIVIEEEETNGREAAHPQVFPGPRQLLPPRAVGLERLTNAIKQHKVVAAVSILIVAFAAVAIFYFTRPAPAIDSIAVIPFVNATGDPNMEYLSDGLSDSVIDRLSQLPNLKKVIAFASVIRYKGKQTDPQIVGSELGVKAVLLGRMARHGDQISIDVELMDVQDNRRIWAAKFERSVSDLPLITADLADQITDRLRIRLTSDEQKQLNKRASGNAEAYQLFLKGRYFQAKYMNQSALEAYQQAIEKDSNYALAYNGVADCYLAMAQTGVVSPEEGYSKARWAAAKAMELDNSLAETYTALAQIRAYFDWDWRGAEADYRHAIELNANVGHGAYSSYLSILGRHDEAIAELRKAQEVDPLSIAVGSNLAWAYYVARQYDQAIEQGKKTLEMEPDFIPAHRTLGAAYLQKKMFTEAIEEFGRIREITKGRGIGGTPGLGNAYAVAGKREEALQIIDQIKAETKNGYAASSWFALIYTSLGEKDLAFEWLEKAFSRHEPAMKNLKVDPAFDPLRSDPRFADLLRRMNLA